jgi:hypothetical protein
MHQALQARQRRKDARWLYVQSVLITIGNLTIAWAGIERMLDELIAWYQHAQHRLQSQHPVSLKNKLIYIKLMQRDPIFTPETQEFLRIVRIEAKRLGAERHNLIHGLLHLSDAERMRWNTQRVVYDGPLASIEHRTYSNDEINRISGEITNFSRYLSPQIWAIINGNPKFISANDLNDAKRKLGLI